METLRILWFNWKDIKNPAAGGAEVFTHEVAKRLTANGHEVTLFTSAFPNSEKEEVLDGVRIIRAGDKYTVYWKAKSYYENLFAREGYDVVIDEINTRPFFTPKFVKKGEKIIVLIHQLAREYWFYETPFPINVLGYYFLEEKWLKAYKEKTTITVSESTKKDLLSLGFREVYVIPEGLSYEPLKKMPAKEPDPTIIYLGRLTRAKRPDHALKAFKLVLQEHPRAKLWFVGDGYMRPKLERLANPNVIFFGRQPRDKVSELLAKAWVFVHSGVREGFGLNVIEANAHWTPAVAYNVPGLRDSVRDGVTGFLVKQGDVRALAGAIIRMIEDEELRTKLSRNAAEYARNFNWDKSAVEMIKVLQAL